MTRLLLVRHSLTDDVGRALSGRAAGIALNEQGRQQAAAVARELLRVTLTAVVASPSQRAIETATPIAALQNHAVEVAEGLAEFEFGAWTGATFRSLTDVPDWRRFNISRSLTRPPRGELMVEVQARIVSTLLDLAERFPDGSVAVISHADVIRAALMFFLGIPLDFVHRLEVLPARISIVDVGQEAPVVRQVNGGTAVPDA